MSHRYAARRLLEHGPLSVRQFREITGWPALQCAQVLWNLLEAGQIARRRVGRNNVYELA